MMKLFLSMMLGTIMATTPAFGEMISCTARTALNQTMTVNLDTTAMTMAATSSQNHIFRGNVNFYQSARYQDHVYFLPTGFNAGIELQIEGTSGDRMLLCLSDDSCYRCR